MIGLFEVTYTRQGYGRTSKEKSTQKTKMFLETFMENKKPFYVPTNRLSGFQQDRIEIKKTKFIREQFPIEITDIDIEGNDLMAVRSIDSFIDETLGDKSKMADKVNEIMAEEELDIEYAMARFGYIMVNHDNTYNYGSDLEDELDYKIFQPENNENEDYIYDDETVIWVERHIGLDVRGGYQEVGLFDNGDMDGLSMFIIRRYIEVTIFTEEGEEGRSYDGDGAIYKCLQDYKLSHVVDHGPDLMPEIFVKNEDGETFEMRLY